LKVIGKAVSLSEAIARSDRGLLPKIKGMVKNLNIDHVTEEISGALDKMNEEIVRSSSEGSKPHRPWWQGEKKTPERRREEQRVKGTVSLFSGIGLTIFLYYLTGALALLAGAILTFFGFMHGERIGIAQTPIVALSYLVVSGMFFGCTRSVSVSSKPAEEMSGPEAETSPA